MIASADPRRPAAVLAAALVITVLAACAGGGASTPEPATPTRGAASPTAATPTAAAPTPTPSPTPAPRYHATVRWTQGGAVHVLADTLADAAFGEGWAFARDHVCILADQILKVRSERSAFLGPGEGDANLDFDFGMLHLGVYARAERDWPSQPQEVRDLVEGFAAGYNRWLAQTPSADLPGWCAGAAWVRPISPVDLFAYYHALALTASGQAVVPAIARAQPPGTSALAPPPAARIRLPDAGIGSNGWALGRARTASGAGMLAANPHFPWEGELRFWEIHLRVPGVLDVYGGSLMGSAVPNIAFTPHLAWTHTFSWASRGTFYRLALDPRDPTRYRYDGGWRTMTPETFTVDVLGEDGTRAPVHRTLYRTHWGPILATEEVGWTATTALTFRDVNEENTHLFQHFFEMGRAADLDAFEALHRDVHAIPWVHTMAVDAGGLTLYMDSSRVPRLSEDTIAAWQARLDAGDPLTVFAWELGVPLLDGTGSADEWTADGAGDATIPLDSAPRLRREDFVFNSNDNHWLANPGSPLTGFSPLYGAERTPRTPRTRMNLIDLTELRDGGASGPDGRFTLDELTSALLSDRGALEETVRAEAAARCAGVTTASFEGRRVDIRAACAALTAWDGRVSPESRGALVWREALATYPAEDLRDGGRLFAHPFDPDDPIATPWGLYTPAQGEEDPLLAALAAATVRLGDAGLPVDATLDQAQYSLKGETRVPVHGGLGIEGVTNMVYYDTNPLTNTSLEPKMAPGPLVHEATGLSTEGYLVNYGSSFLLAVEYTPDGPRARALMTYSQSADPASPHYADQGAAFQEGRWREVRFTEEEILADPALVIRDVSGG